MKKIIINNLMKAISANKEYEDEKLAVIKYGLESIYLTMSKLIIIGVLAYILNIFNELVIFLLIYNVIRMTSFGLHATKSWICLLVSTVMFILIPLFCNYYFIPIYIKVIIGVILIILFYKNSPADTEKRPIVNYKRRKVYQLLSTLIAIAFVLCSVFIKDTYISNSFFMSLVVQAFMISPFIYKIFNLSYNNYKSYLTQV